MTDEGIKKLLGYLLRNKEMIYTLINNFQPEEVERGLLSIPEKLINRDLKMLIMDKSGPYLNDYELLFRQDAIFVDIDVNAKQLGRLKAKYMLTITGLEFSEYAHKLQLSYQEDVKSEGNFMQSMAIKAAGLKGSYLQTAAEMLKKDYLKADKDSILIDLDAIKAAEKIPPTLNISYVSSEDGLLKLKFYI